MIPKIAIIVKNRGASEERSEDERMREIEREGGRRFPDGHRKSEIVK